MGDSGNWQLNCGEVYDFGESRESNGSGDYCDSGKSGGSGESGDSVETGDCVGVVW